MSNIYTCDYTYTTNALVITKQIKGMTLKIFAEFIEEIIEQEALNTVLDTLADIYMSKCRSYEVGESSKLKRLEKLTVANLYTYNYTYTTNVLIITKQAKGMTLKICAELTTDIPKEKALSMVLELFLEICTSEGFALDGGWALNETLLTDDNQESSVKRLISENNI